METIKRYLRIYWVKVVFTLLWLFLVLYPNPYHLYESIHRTINPPINPVAVEGLLYNWAVPDPEVIEKYVLDLITYQYDWTTYSMPWYFPTVEEVLSRGAGDCKSRMIVLASIFQTLDIPYEIRYSVNHFWVHYETRTENRLERGNVAFLASGPAGASLQMPEIDYKVTLRAFRSSWSAMPIDRKILFYSGFFLPTILINMAAKRFRKQKMATIRGVEIEDTVL